MGKLTKDDLANLHWMKRANDKPEGIGLFYSIVARFGPLLDAGFCELRLGATKHNQNGYWITPAGREALKEQDDG